MSKNVTSQLSQLSVKCQYMVFAVAFCFAVFFSFNVLAQSIQPRLSSQQTYDRFVFEWPNAVNYKAESRRDGTLVLEFNTSGSVDVSSLSKSDLRYVRAVQSDGNRVTFYGEEETSFRHFKIGGKIIVDVSGPKLEAERVQSASATSDSAAPPATTPTPVATETPEPTREPLQELEKGTAQPSEITMPYQPAPSVEPLKVDDVKQVPLTDDQEGVITVSSTKAFGMSAFVKDKHLWIVSDQKDMVIAPQVQGKASYWLGKPKRFNVEEGTIFAFRWPFAQKEYVTLNAEGGGLLWRLEIMKGAPGKKGSIRSVEMDGKQDAAVMLGLPGMHKVVAFTYPPSGQRYYAATVEKAGSFVHLDRSFWGFSIVPSLVGGVVADTANNIKVTIADNAKGALITGQGPFASLSEQSAKLYRAAIREMLFEADDESNRVYNFDTWSAGGFAEYDQNRISLEEALAETEEGSSKFVETGMALVKLHLANLLPQESLGYYNLLEPSAGDRVDNIPEFMAIRAAASALSGQGKIAEEVFAREALAQFPEIDYWSAYNYARMEEWKKAYQKMPDKPDYIENYPKELFYEITLLLAEAALREPDTKRAETYLTGVQENMADMVDPYMSNYNYLMGELRRQKGDTKGALSTWRDLLENGDRLYRAKAALAWSKLALNTGEITPERAVELLEQIRFTWRGDGLETQIGHELGLAYVKEKSYKKALSLLRDTASYARDEDNRREIVEDMQNVFSDLFLGDLSKGLSPIQSVSIYEAFSELLPVGEEGDKIIQALVRKLVDVDLVDRAAKLLDQLIENRLTGLDRSKNLVKLARLYVLGREAEKALDVLENMPELGDSEEEQQIYKDAILVKAKALADSGRVREALSTVTTLGSSPEVDQLRADIAWSNQQWNDAANALITLIGKQGIARKKKLSDEEAKLILNTAVAINLAGDLQRLQNFQKRFSKPMDDTEFGKLFRIVTRPPGDAFLSSRQTILGIVDEVNLFEGILEQF